MGANRYIKTAIIGRALLVAVIGFYISLFILRQWLVSWLWMIAVFCILPYVIIYFNRYWRRGAIVIAVASCGLGFYLGWNLYLAIGFLCAFLLFYNTSASIDQDIHNKIKVSGLDIFTGNSISTFVTRASLLYVFTFMSFYQSFDLACDEIYGYSDEVINLVLLRDDSKQVEKIKASIAEFFITPVSEVTTTTTTSSVTGSVTITNGNTTNRQIPTQKSEPDLGAKYRVKSDPPPAPVIVDVMPAKQVENTPLMSGSTQSIIEIFRSIESYRKNIIEQTVDQSNVIQNSMCDSIVGEIQERYDDPQFRVSVIYMMYILISGAVGIIFNIISYINWSLFELMFHIGWFRKFEDWEVTENLE